MYSDDFIVNNLIDSLSTSKLISFLIENYAFNQDVLKLEILKATLIHRKPDFNEKNTVTFYDEKNKKTTIKFLILSDINSDKIFELKAVDEETIHVLLYNVKSLSKANIDFLLSNLNKQLAVTFNFKIFKYLNGEIGIIYYSSKSKIAINEIDENVKKRKRISLPTGTYSKVLEEIKESLNENDVITFLDLMLRFKNDIESKLEKQKKVNPNINIDEQLMIFEQEYGTGAKRSQILLHTINEKNRIYFRNKIPSKLDLFVYDPQTYQTLMDIEKTPLNNRFIKAFNPFDIYNEDVDVFYEKGKSPIKVKDFNNRYIK